MREQQRRWQYILPIRYGPLATSALGLVLVIIGIVSHRPGPVIITLLTLGVVLVIAEVLIPRVKGSIEVTATAVKGALAAATEAS